MGVAVASLFASYQDHLPRVGTRGPQTASGQAVPARAEAAALLQPASQQLIGPTGAVKAVQFSGASRRVVTIAADASLRVWDATSGALIHRIALQEGAATALATQDTLAITGHSDGTLVLWDLDTGNRLASFKRGTDALTAVAFAPENDHLVAASGDGSLVVWNRKSPATPVQVSDARAGAVTTLVRVTARDAVAYALADKTIRLTSSEGLAPIRSYRGNGALITALDSPDDGRALASAGADGQIRIWSTASNRMIRSFKAHTGSIIALSYAASGDALASAGADGILKIWDAKRGRLLASAQGRASGVHALAFAADGRRIATAEGDGTVRLWDSGSVKANRE